MWHLFTDYLRFVPRFAILAVSVPILYVYVSLRAQKRTGTRTFDYRMFVLGICLAVIPLFAIVHQIASLTLSANTTMRMVTTFATGEAYRSYCKNESNDKDVRAAAEQTLRDPDLRWWDTKTDRPGVKLDAASPIPCNMTPRLAADYAVDKDHFPSPTLASGVIMFTLFGTISASGIALICWLFLLISKRKRTPDAVIAGF